MSYGQKPSSAWARSQGSQQQINPNLFTGQLGLAASSQPFGAIPGMPLAGLVNQAAFSNTMGMNMLAQAQRSQIMAPQQQQLQQVQQRQQTQQSSSPARSQRTFVGVITKMMETYGFVDEDVFFQTSVIRGTMPRLGDRVMVEANYNPSMPFKWNAYLVRLLQDTPQVAHQQPTRQAPQQQSQNGIGSANRWSGGGSERRSAAIRDEPRRPVSSIQRRSPVKRPASRQRSPPRRSSPRKRESPPPRREVFAKKDRETDRGGSSVRGQSTKLDGDSPPRRRQRLIPRYHCNMPKQTLPCGELKNADLRRRYASLYIPSDFIRCSFDWTTSIPLGIPIKFSSHPINFHVLHKDIDAPMDGESSIENPSDADYRFLVKVMLISHPGLMSIRRKLSGLMADGSIDESTETQPLTKTVQLLVGHRGKGEYMCIGGPWSPSLDGKNPLDPVTLVKTAIRTTKAMTGLNLAECSKWYKIAHLRYLRPERQRIDSVVLMLPDTSAIESFKVTEESYKETEQILCDQLAVKLAAIDAEQFNDKKSVDKDSSGENGEKLIGVGKETEKLVEATSTTSTCVPPSSSETETAEAASSLITAEEEMETSQNSETGQSLDALQSPKKEVKTHWSLLETTIRTMKVVELREELDLRGIDSKGLKNVLTQRLSEAILKEKEEETKVNDGGIEQGKETEGQQGLNKEAEQSINNPVEQEKSEETTSPQKSNEPSIMVKIKEEIIELMETDEACEENKESPEEQAKREQLEKERIEMEKAKENFEKEKKERKATLERHYSQIPKEPGIFVYPSKTAKNGKFECKLMSLHSLLDYRQDDIKESSFEVFLFVEALREALDRSNAFVVYHTIATALDRETEKKRRNESLSEACKDEEVVVINENVGKDEKEIEKQPKSPTQSFTDLRTNFKAVVNNLDIFSSFVHFDGNICGFLTDRDLEEIINSTGLDLSRSEVKNLVKKVSSSKERINYRDFTDKWVDKEGNVKYIPEPTYQGSLFDSYNELAKGHYNLENSKSINSSNDLQIDSTEESSNGIFVYEGKIVNLKQCIQQQLTIEEERQSVLDKNNELDLKLKTIKEQRDVLEKKKRRLEDDVDRYRKKLHDVEKNLKKEKDDNEMVKKALNDCKRYGDRIVTIVDHIFPKQPVKEQLEVLKNNNNEIENGGGGGRGSGGEEEENKEKEKNNKGEKEKEIVKENQEKEENAKEEEEIEEEKEGTKSLSDN